MSEEPLTEEGLANAAIAELGDQAIPITVSLEELHCIQLALQHFLGEFDGISAEARNIVLARDMVNVFLPVLVGLNHPRYVQVPNAEDNVGSDKGTTD